MIWWNKSEYETTTSASDVKWVFCGFIFGFCRLLRLPRGAFWNRWIDFDRLSKNLPCCPDSLFKITLKINSIPFLFFVLNVQQSNYSPSKETHSEGGSVPQGFWFSGSMSELWPPGRGAPRPREPPSHGSRVPSEVYRNSEDAMQDVVFGQMLR